jgi:hypothetical protein
MAEGFNPATGHAFRVEGARGPVWYAQDRLPDGRQVQKRSGRRGPERGRPANGYFTKRLAEDWLRSTLDEARRGTLSGMVRTGWPRAPIWSVQLSALPQPRGSRAVRRRRRIPWLTRPRCARLAKPRAAPAVW